MRKSPIRVLLVDDSAFVLNVLKHMLDQNQGITIVGTAKNGQEALDFVLANRVDVVLLDVVMPVMDGAEATRLIMKKKPTPMVILTALGKKDPRVIMALQNGAVEFVQKPGGNEKSPLLHTSESEIVEAIKVAYRSKTHILPRRSGPSRRSDHRLPSSCDLVVVAVSTGGPSTLRAVLGQLPASFPAPLLIVQHIISGYTKSLVESLQLSCSIGICEATNGLVPQPGTAYIARSGSHLQIGGNQRLLLSSSEPVGGFRPAADALFTSAAKSFDGTILGVVLTGMGSDGCAGCGDLKAAGHTVIIQDKETSVVWGMPGAVHKKGSFDQMMSIKQIAHHLENLKPSVPTSSISGTQPRKGADS